MFKVNATSKIYIVCPGPIGAAAGGIESLHQLCHILNKLNYNAFMVYHAPGNIVLNEKNKMYDIYDTKFALDIEDNANNIMIFPEVYVCNVFYDRSFTDWVNVIGPNCQKAIWWLAGMDDKHNLSLLRGNIIHLFQCYHAMLTLKQKGINGYFLSDCIEGSFKKKLQNNAFSHKRDLLVYNPNKDIEITKNILSRLSGFETVALINMNRNEMINMIQNAKVYIDFGHHPGKDRIPREAVLGGCCVIVGLQGSAANDYDMPIDRTYKFAFDDLPNIVNKINECVTNYGNHILKFENYRNRIQNDYVIMEDEVLKLFLRN